MDRAGATITGHSTAGPATGGRRRLTIMISSAGRRVGLVEAFRRGAADLGLELEVLACDLSPQLSAACQVADKCFAVPRADEPGYAEALLAICREREVHLLVPTIDPELEPLSRARERFEAQGTQLSVSAPELIAIARDKAETASFLAACGIPTPITLPLEAVRDGAEACGWPVIVKPRHGSAGRSISIAGSGRDLPPSPSEPMIVQQLLQGEEWTVNLFFARANGLRAIVPHRRIQVRAGEVEKGRTCRNPALEAIARRMADHLPGPQGALCFQAMVGAEGSVGVFEINARFGGGYPLADRAGAPFARWLLEERAELPSSAADDWREGVTMLRYDAAVFLAGDA